MYCRFVFFFKQKTAYEMRISDWSSYVCSSDLDPAQSVAKLRPVDDHVQHAVRKQIFRALEALRQLLADRAFDHALPRKADERVRLGYLDVAKHRIGRGEDRKSTRLKSSH